MNHKEKCKIMKDLRKQIADNIGVDLHQTECTYQGECKGTCPRCAQEEKKLNKALVGKRAAVAGLAMSTIALTGCNGYFSGASEALSNTLLDAFYQQPDDLTGEAPYYPDDIEGMEEVNPEFELDGDVEYVEPDDYELMGDTEYVAPDYDEDELY